MILDADVGYPSFDQRGALRAITLVLVERERSGVGGTGGLDNVSLGTFDPPTEVVTDGPSPVAYVNESRWVVDCPFCPSAQLASREDPHFFCANCLNQPVGGALMKVQWPTKAEIQRGETALLDRPFLRNRNWYPDREKASRLERENAEMSPSFDPAVVVEPEPVDVDPEVKG